MKKILLIFLLLISACTVKPEDIEPEEVIEEQEEIEPGDHNDFVILKEGIRMEDYDYVVQDYYSNSLAVYKNDELIQMYSPQGEYMFEPGSICSTNLRDFHFNYASPADPGNLTLTCDGSRQLFGYSDDFKMIYPAGVTEADYSVGALNAIKMFYITKTSPIVKEIDVNSYYHRELNDPLIINEYRQFTADGIYPVYELNEEPKLVDNILTFDLTGKVGIVTGESRRADIIASLQFEGVGADTSTLDGLVTVIKDGKIGLADKTGKIVVEPIYEPLTPIQHQLYSENYKIEQKGPEVSTLRHHAFIDDYWSNTFFISSSSNATGFRPVKKDGKVGFLDEKGNELDTFYFEDAFIAKTNRAWVKQDGLWSIIEIGKDIGYQQEELVNRFNQEPALIKEMTEKYLKGDMCDVGYSLYEVNSEEGLYIRDGADLESGYLGIFNYQQKVCGKETGDWVEFDYNGQSGYLYAEYMTKMNP